AVVAGDIPDRDPQRHVRVPLHDHLNGIERAVDVAERAYLHLDGQDGRDGRDRQDGRERQEGCPSCPSRLSCPSRPTAAPADRPCPTRNRPCCTPPARSPCP